MNVVILTRLLLLISILNCYYFSFVEAKIIQNLDENGLVQIEFDSSKSDDFKTLLRIRAHRLSKGTDSFVQLPFNLSAGIEIFVDGKQHYSNPYRPLSLFSEGMLSGNDSASIWMNHDKHIIELKFYGQSIGKYEVHGDKINQLESPKMLSRFHIRRFENDRKEISKGVYTSITGPEGNVDLKEWIKSPVFTSNKPTAFSSIVDLHTHFAGALTSDDLFQIGEKLSVPYPVEYIKEMGLNYNKDAVFIKEGKEYIPFSRKNIEFATFHDGHDYHWSSIYDGFEIPPNYTVSFEQMQKIYKMREPIIKNQEAFSLMLKAVAEDYAKNGVKYAELSFYQIIHPEWLEMANKLIPEIEKQYGVRLRFLVGARRHNDLKWQLDDIEKMIAAMKKSPYVVGIDFMGHETNSTLDFAKALEKLDQLKTQFPGLVVRVHAGENPKYPNNIIDAIKAGANRIGHGIYGVTDEVVKLAKEKNVTIEFNFNSNLALKNVEGVNRLKLSAKKYLDAGVRVTFGTDGHGLYSTSPMSEEAVGRALGFTDDNFRQIRAFDEEYVRTMSRFVLPSFRNCLKKILSP